MKAYKIKKNKNKTPVFIANTKGTLDKPKPPLTHISKFEKQKVFVSFERKIK